jgi:hypothetical protein
MRPTRAKFALSSVGTVENLPNLQGLKGRDAGMSAKRAWQERGICDRPACGDRRRTHETPAGRAEVVVYRREGEEAEEEFSPRRDSC